MKFKIVVDTLEPTLEKYRQSRALVTSIIGPLGSGKTYASCESIFERMCEQEPDSQGRRKTRFFAVRNTYSELLTTTIKDWLYLYEDLGRFTRGGSSPPTHLLKFRLQDKTIVDAEFIFISMDRPQSIRKLRGSQLTGVWINESKEIDKAVIDMALLRIGRYPSAIDGGPTWYGMLCDSNAPDDDNWLYKIHEEDPPENWDLLKQPGGVMREMVKNDHDQLEWNGKWIPDPLAENLHNLPDEYYIRGMEGKDDDWIAVNLANEYGDTNDGKPIYQKQWSDTLHVSDTIQVIPDAPIIVGMDFGLTPAAIIGQETPNGTINILDEVIGEGMGIEQFVKSALKPILNESYKNCEWNFVGDPAGNRRADTNEETVFKVLDDLGMPCEAANTNDPTIRWEAVRDPLQQLRDGKPAFQLHKRCRILRKGFNSGYQFKRIHVTGTTRYNDKADKNKYSHPHDGLQYLMMWVQGDTIATVGFRRNNNQRASM